MNDLVSREAVIDAIRYRVCQGQGNKEHICNRGSCAYCGIMEIMNDISSIPSSSGWISTKDRLPERGIGGITKAENKDEYTLDPIGDVYVRANKVLFEIPCEW